MPVLLIGFVTVFIGWKGECGVGGVVYKSTPSTVC